MLTHPGVTKLAPSFPRYRMAQKPVYQVKQKVLASVAWRCCPGFVGPDCQHHGRAPPVAPSPPTSDPRGQAVPLTCGVTIVASSPQIPRQSLSMKI